MLSEFLPKAQASSGHLEPQSCPTIPHHLNPKIQVSGHQPSLLRFQLPGPKLNDGKRKLAPTFPTSSPQQRTPTESACKVLVEVWGGAEARAVRRAEPSWVDEVGQAGEKRPFECRSRGNRDLPPPPLRSLAPKCGSFANTDTQGQL